MSFRDYNTANVDKDGLPIYGMDAEIKAKMEAKKNPQMEREVRHWIETVTGEKFSSNDFQEALKDGLLLCKLINSIKPGTIASVNTSKLAFKQMENIDKVIRTAKAWGVKDVDLFMTVDLYEGKNIPQVIQTLTTLSSALSTGVPSYKGPTIGIKVAEKNEREFTPEQLAKSSATMSKISMGSVGGANQSGMRDGSREIIKTNDTGDSSTVSKISMGSVGGANQSGMRDTSKEVIKTKDTGTTGVSKQTMGSFGGATQSGMRDTSKEVIKVKDPGSTGVSKQTMGSHGGANASGMRDTSHEIVKGPSNNKSLDDLEKLAALRDKGILTEQEFQAKKAQILGL